MRRAETKRPLAVHDGSDQVYDPTTAKGLPPVLQTNNRDLHLPQNSSYCSSLASLPTLHTRNPIHPKASPPSHPLPSFSTPATKPLTPPIAIPIPIPTSTRRPNVAHKSASRATGSPSSRICNPRRFGRGECCSIVYDRPRRRGQLALDSRHVQIPGRGP